MALINATANNQTLVGPGNTGDIFSANGFTGVLFTLSGVTDQVTWVLEDLLAPGGQTATLIGTGVTGFTISLNGITLLQGGDEDDAYTSVDPITTAFTFRASEGTDSYDFGDNATISYAAYGLGLTFDLDSGIVDGKLGGAQDTFLSNPDTLVGTAFDDVFLVSDSGIANIVGGGGNDTLSFAATTFAVTVALDFGTTNTGSVQSFSGISTFIGSSLGDSFVGLDGTGLTFVASEGSDAYDAAGGTLTYAGTASALTIDLDSGAVTGKADGSTDSLVADLSTIIAGSGDDTVIVSSGATYDLINGGAGVNTLSYAAFVSGVSVSLLAGTGPNATSFINFTNLTGGDGNDTLTGNAGNNVLEGGLGDNQLNGGAGQDTVVLAGTRASWTITDNLDGTATATNGSSTQTLNSIENLVFDDGAAQIGYHAPLDLFGAGNSAALFLADFNGDLWTWQVNGSGPLQYVPISTVGTVWDVVGTGNINGDAYADIWWQHDDGLLYYWNMDGAALGTNDRILSQGANYRVDQAEWTLLATADLNGDAVLDFLWQRVSDGLLYVWEMDATGHLIGSQGNLLSNGDADLTFAAAGSTFLAALDVNNDGMADAIWQDSTGVVTVQFLDGQSLTSVGSAGLIEAGTFVGAGKSGAATILFFEDTSVVGQTFLTAISLGLNGTSVGLQYEIGDLSFGKTGDYDGDGDVDVILINGADYYLNLSDGSSTVAPIYIGTAADQAIYQYQLVG